MTRGLEGAGTRQLSRVKALTPSGAEKRPTVFHRHGSHDAVPKKKQDLQHLIQLAGFCTQETRHEVREVLKIGYPSQQPDATGVLPLWGK